ncbi:MAG TPA: MBL fold metallo-hydrolase [Gemmatimonadales bacterium]|nr:MBL fold metallo-hydrolase [Gemmatimonadales bacterium]
MMMLYVLGSGSAGNCFAVETEGVALLIDAGFSGREVERRADLVGLELSRVAGIALTHEHGDHARGAASLARRLRVPVLTGAGTWRRLVAAMDDAEHRPLGLSSRGELGPFVIDACPTSHDASDPLAIVVRTTDGTSVGVAYDLGRATTAVRYLLRQVSAIVLEANHDEVQLRTSEYPAVVQRRIAGSGGHLSNRAAAQLLAELHHPGLSIVVLAHLSRHCNSAAEARATVARVLRRAGFRGMLHVAEQEAPLPPIVVAPAAGLQFELAL